MRTRLHGNDGLNHAIHRRTFLKIGSLALLQEYLGTQSPEQTVDAAERSVFLQRQNTRKQVIPVVYVHLEGGASPWDTFTPFEVSVPREYRGQYESIATSIPGVHFSELLPRLAMHADKTTLIRAVDSQSLDHFVSTRNLLVRENKVLGLTVGEKVPDAIVPYTFLNTEGRYQNDSATLEDHHPPDGLRIDWNAERQTFSAPNIGNTTGPDIGPRRELLEKLDRLPVTNASLQRTEDMRERAFALLTGKGAYFDAFDVSHESLEQFGQDPSQPPNQFAHAAAVADSLVRNGAGFVTIHDCYKNGWDLHSGSDVKEQLPVLCDQLDRGLVELMKRARLHGYLVICSSEFGRTPYENSSQGRDHHSVHNAIGAGGRLREGAVIGELTRRGEIKSDGINNTVLREFIVEAAGGAPQADLAKLSQLLEA